MRQIDRPSRACDRKLGEKRALDDAEIADIIGFVRTVTDGHRPIANRRPNSRAVNGCRCLHRRT
jgi:hypothetical protein